MSFLDLLRKAQRIFHLQKDAPPPPRWQRLVASFYLGLLLYLAAHMGNLV